MPSSFSTQAEANLHLLSHLYAQRSSSLWKPTETASWLKTVALATLPDISTTPHPFRRRFISLFADATLSYSIYRHATLLDATTTRRLTAFFPPAVLKAQSVSCDPLPPLTAVNQYDQEFFGATDDVFAFRPRTRREREADARNLERLIPDAAVREQLQVRIVGYPSLGAF